MAQMNEIVLHNFGYAPKGYNPSSGVVRDAAGNFYGIAAGGTHNRGVIYRIDASGNETALYNFMADDEGCTPSGNLAGDGAGNIYGTMTYCGSHNVGTVYKLDKTGHLTVLHAFAGGADGFYPHGVARDAAGNLYGATSPQPHGGTLYKLDSAGNYSVLYTFTGGSDGDGPQDIIADSAGNLYGATYAGGATGAGVIFKLSKNGIYTVLYNFTGGIDGGRPTSGVVRDSAGNLYGVTANGGFGSGVVYKLDSTGKETVLHNFSNGPGDVCSASGNLSGDAAGNLYGIASNCGALGLGGVFKLDRSGHETVLHFFSGSADGKDPNNGLALDPAGNVYGTASKGGPNASGLLFRIDPAGNFSTVAGFASAYDGTGLYASLAGDGKGNLFGTANSGGAQNDGVVYQWNAKTGLIVMHSFAGGADGDGPQTGVIADASGNVYGTTFVGGNQLCGVAFKVDPTGQETVLHSFTCNGLDGANPFAGLVRDSAGNLYGTTTAGGSANVGVIFRIDPSGHEIVLYNFIGGADGAAPNSALVGDAAGNLYGTTSSGGGAANAGVVFKLDRSGRETVLYSFAGGADGGAPSGVVRDLGGNLYGTTQTGGPANCGTIFKIDSSGHKTVLYSFTTGIGGVFPSGVILDSSGNLYGNANGSGASKSGVVYKLDPAGHQTVLYSFTGGADGGYPNGVLLRDAAGNIYGTAAGGKYNGGVIFMLTNTPPASVTGE